MTIFDDLHKAAENVEITDLHDRGLSLMLTGIDQLGKLALENQAAIEAQAEAITTLKHRIDGLCGTCVDIERGATHRDDHRELEGRVKALHGRLADLASDVRDNYAADRMLRDRVLALEAKLNDSP